LKILKNSRGGGFGVFFQISGLVNTRFMIKKCTPRKAIPASRSPASTKWKPEYDKWCAPDSAIYTGLKDGTLTIDGD
jgi:hypothetical protein